MFDTLVSLGLFVVLEQVAQLPWHVEVNVGVHVILPFRPIPASNFQIGTCLIAIIWPAIFSWLGIYRARWNSRLLSPAMTGLAASWAGFALIDAFTLFSLHGSRALLLTFAVVDIGVLAGSRLILSRRLPSALRCWRVVIVGMAEPIVRAAALIDWAQHRGLDLVGVLDLDAATTRRPERNPERLPRNHLADIPWRFGAPMDIFNWVIESRADMVMLALPSDGEHFFQTVLDVVAPLPVQVFSYPAIYDYLTAPVMDRIHGVTVAGLAEPAIDGWAAWIKHVLDVVISLLALMILSPLLLAIAALIKMDSPGPAIFKQERVGQHNRRFIMYKFRTMYAEGDEQTAEVALWSLHGLVHKQRADPRVTRFGSVLRRASLDELPQLINVLKGDMSLVGPRPELPWLVAQYESWQFKRFLVPQGITGWWQVQGRSDHLMHLNTEDDLYYVRHWSLWLDLRILLLTVRTVLQGKGAY